MSTVISAIKALPNVLPLKPATEPEIVDAEEQLSLRFADDYKQYLATFGAILADGIELTGIAKSKARDVVFVTMQEWEINPDVPMTMYVIENVGIEGIVVWQDQSAQIFRSTPHNAPIKIAASLMEYIESKKK